VAFLLSLQTSQHSDYIYCYNYQPFPLNPSFKPPTPISHVQKERIYKAFVAAAKEKEGEQDGEAKSETYYARQLALQFGLSIDRIKAIVRLKALEKNLSASGKELQMQFLNGMEQALGVSTGVNLTIKEPLDIAQETGQQYGVAKKTQYIMLDEENLEDIEMVEKELQARERRRTKAAASIGQEDASQRPEQLLQVTKANSEKSFKRSTPVGLQYTDIPGRRIRNYSKPPTTDTIAEDIPVAEAGSADNVTPQ
jgi:hypothetical protein